MGKAKPAMVAVPVSGLRASKAHPLAEAALGVGLGVGYAVKGLGISLTPRHRATSAPWWIAAAAVVSSAWPAQAAAWWMACAVLAMAGRQWMAGAGHGLSAREWELLSMACSVAGIWAMWRSRLPWAWAITVLLVATVALGLPWWHGRRIRHDGVITIDPDPEPEFPATWDGKISAAFPELAGTWLEWDPDTCKGVLELSKGTAAGVISLAAQVEGLLNLVPGSLILSRRREDPARTLRVALLGDVVAQEDEIEYWSGPTLGDDGLMSAGRTPARDVAHLALWRSGGACHGVVSGGTGSGKGGAARTILIEGALSPEIFAVVIDGKMNGQGLVEARAGVDVYATRDDAAATIRMLHALLDARTRRYVDRYGSSRWSITRDPLILVMIDETPVVVAHLAATDPEALRMLDELAATSRSAGIGLWLISQRGDVKSLGGDRHGAAIRNNLLAGGTGLVGAPGDRRSNDLAVQMWSSEGVTAGMLPQHPGHMLVLSKVIPGGPVQVRFPYLPSRDERDLDGRPAPHGVAEDVFARRRPAVLDPEDRAVLVAFGCPPELLASTTVEPPADGVDDPDGPAPGHARPVTLPVVPPSAEADDIPDGEPDWAWQLTGGRGEGRAGQAGRVPPPREQAQRARAGADALPALPPPSLRPAAPLGEFQARVLAWLTDHGPARAAGIADALGIDPGSTRRALRRLAQRGAVESTDDGWRTVNRTD